MTDSTFQLHAVSALDRSDGGTSVADVEAKFSEEVDAAIAQKTFSALLDFNAGLYTEDLDFYGTLVLTRTYACLQTQHTPFCRSLHAVERLTCGDVDFLPVRGIPERLLLEREVRVPSVLITAHFYMEDVTEDLGPTYFVPVSRATASYHASSSTVV